MKKKVFPYKNGSSVFKILLRMRLTVFLILLNVLGVYAKESYSQNFNLDYKNTSIKQVLEDIKKQSDLEFFYSNDDFDTSSKIDISIKNGTLEEVLDKVILPTGMQYKVVDDTVIISKNSTQKTVPLQQQPNIIKGKVTDPEGLPLPGATITIVGTTKGVITDNDGVYSIEANPRDKLVFSFVGMESQIVDVGNQQTIDIEMGEKVDELEEVTVVAFGKQRKESVISSIQTINTDELRVPSSNLTQALSGRMAGVISYQTSGEPGQDDAEFFIRGITSFGTGKVDPLILVDNVEVKSSDLASLHPDDIAGFSILKDATATALYGARGANGVILVTTKEGKEGKMKVSVRVENSFSSPTKEIEMADPITYMKLANEAALTRDPLGGTPYTFEKIDNTIRNPNPYIYPATDWSKELFKDLAINQRANLNISGGGKIARYYLAASFSQDNGILKVDKRNNFNNNIDLKKYLIRSNVNINLTNSTEAIIRIHGTFKDYKGPITGGSGLYQSSLNVSPVRFPAYYLPDENYRHAQHILFGGYDQGQYMNPYAEMVRGYREYSDVVMLAQFEIKQDFSNLIDGLSARFLGNTTRYSYFDLTRSYNPFYYNIASYDRRIDEYTLMQLNPEKGTEYLSYNPGAKNITSSFYSESSLLYNKAFGKHDVSGMLVYITRSSLYANATILSESLPHRNLGLSGRFSYAYDKRYFTEFNFGYNGSEKFDKGHRWGFFPSFGVGWVLSNEPFWEGDIKKVLSKFKIRGTYGLVGNDNIGAERFFYLSRVNMGGGNSYQFGYNFNGKQEAGVVISHYGNSEIGWEVAYKKNLGIELGLFEGKIDINADIFSEYRKNILQTRSDIPATMGLWATPQVNIGEAKGKGVDISFDYNHAFGNNWWLVGRGNFTFAKSIFEYYEEPDYSSTPWKSKINNPISQKWGYVAERLFIDDADVENSPRQDFGEYGAGDIKYKDISDDGVINELDMVPIGYPTVPEINYGFGLSVGYKNFDLSFFFHGSGRSSFWIDSRNMAPFIRYSSNGLIHERGLTNFIADDYWSEISQDPYAGWPRLSNYTIDNNTQRSTWFMRNGSFLRLKNAEFGYSLPGTIVKSLKLSDCRLYISGSNLLLFSGFNTWDVEMGGSGLGYPLQRVFNVGVNVSF
jgi:TonB-linked SusC/RagA family outer membrane protein